MIDIDKKMRRDFKYIGVDWVFIIIINYLGLMMIAGYQVELIDFGW